MFSISLKHAYLILDEVSDQKVLKTIILEMIDTLPVAQRSTLYMFNFEEMSLKNIRSILKRKFNISTHLPTSLKAVYNVH